MRDWLTKDIWWKLFSVGLAIAVWLTMHNYRFESGASEEARAITYSDLSVMPVSLSEGKRVQIVPDTVSVKVSGPDDVMAVLQGKEIHPLVNLDGIDSGRDLRRPVEVAVRTGVTVIKVDPSEVYVTVSPLTETNEEKQP